MPEVVRKPSRYSKSEKPGSDHSFPGSRSQARLENTLLLDFDTDDQGVVILVTNVAPHAVPASPLREIRLEMTLTTAAGKIIASKVEIYRHPLDVAGTPKYPPVSEDRPGANEFRQVKLKASQQELHGSRLEVRTQYRRAEDHPWQTIATISNTF